MDENRVTYFAETDARNKRLKFGIKAKDRTRHVYVIGKTGMGKSTLLENMAVQDIQNGEGFCFIDPHGKTADLLLEYVPENRIRDVIMIAPFDTEYPISFNVLESVDPDKRHLVVSGLMSTFKKIWVDAWSARMEYILTNTLLALLEAPGTTLLGVNKMLSDKAYRNEIISHVKDPSVKTFWTKEFANYTERMAQEAVPAIQNKVGQFTANPLIRNMIGQPQSSFDFRKAMDSRKILVINLSKGRIGDENMKLLGGMLVTKIYLAAMSRADVPDRVLKTLPNFYLFVDEFQNFANASFADILSEARKYKLNLTIAHQYVEQMDELVRAAVFGNVGTMIAFRVGATDAELLEKEFTPQFTVEDLVNLGFAQVYLKLMIDGLTSPPFSAVTLPPIPHPDVSFVSDIINASREQFARPRLAVEEEIVKFHESSPKKPEQKQAAIPTSAFANSKPSSDAVGSQQQTRQQSGQTVSTSPGPSHAKPLISNVTGERKNFNNTSRAENAQRPIVSRPTPPLDNDGGFSPISALKEQINKTMQPIANSPVQQPQQVKPVSLSSLEKKIDNRNERPNSKVASQQNVSELKNALAEILKKSPVVAPANVSPNTKLPSSHPVPQSASLDKRDSQIIGAVSLESSIKPIPKIVVEEKVKVPPQTVPKAEKDANEVPEEVLQNVLKV